MQRALTIKQARQITGGRVPHVPVEYETAVTALQACIDLDEGKYWADKADMLAAWAKMYRNDDAGRKARMLKLHAYRRMGQLAAELNPRRAKTGEGVGKGSVPGSGPRSLMLAHGLTVAEVGAARALARIPQRQFDQILRNPVSPTTIRSRLYQTTEWHYMQASLMSVRSRCRVDTPAQVVDTMSEVECANAREMVREIVEWFDEFDQRCAKKVRK